jgi:hypothetical protein
MGTWVASNITSPLLPNFQHETPSSRNRESVRDNCTSCRFAAKEVAVASAIHHIGNIDPLAGAPDKSDTGASLPIMMGAHACAAWKGIQSLMNMQPHALNGQDQDRGRFHVSIFCSGYEAQL